MKMLTKFMQPPEMLHASRFREYSYIFTTALLLSQLYAYPASGAG